MKTPAEDSSERDIAKQAAHWLARRDRGLSPAEQDAYVQWLAADPRHVAEVRRLAAAFSRMTQLYEWQPGQASEPNPDLFLARPRSRWWQYSLGFAAMLAVLFGGFALWRQSRLPIQPLAGTYLRINERQVLPDGSLVELKDGSHLTTGFGPDERRVTLTGEGHFTVAKDARRPFIVQAGGVTVRAVGTAFNVRVEPESVEILVTEGRVRVHPTPKDRVAGKEIPQAPEVTAQQRAIVARRADAAPVLEHLTREQIEESLAWQAPRLQFFETPLSVAVAEFNQRNRTQLVISDAALKRVPIGGSFRVDNIDGFLRALEVTIDVRAEPRGANEIVLTRAR